MKPRVLYALSTRLSALDAYCPTSILPFTELPELPDVAVMFVPADVSVFAVVVVVTVFSF